MALSLFDTYLGNSLQFQAGWQSGHAAACKAVYAGSIPASASNANNMLSHRPGGEIGRRKGLKIPRFYNHAGSSPALGTKIQL